MKKLIYFFSLIVLLFLTSCSSKVDIEVEKTELSKGTTMKITIPFKIDYDCLDLSDYSDSELDNLVGKNVLVIDGDYNGRHELDYFIDHPASSEEQDWQAIKKKAGIS